MGPLLHSLGSVHLEPKNKKVAMLTYGKNYCPCLQCDVPQNPMGRLSMCLDFFSFFLCSQHVPFKFSMNSHHVPNVFPIAPRFNPICFAQSPPLLTYIVGPKEEALHLSIESSIFWGASIVSTFMFLFFLQ